MLTTYDRQPTTVPSLRRRVVSMPAMNFQALMLGQNLDGAIPAIVPETLGTIRQSILTAQIGLYLGKCVGHVGHLKRFKPAAARRISDTLQNLVVLAALGITGKIGADGINDHVCPQGHFDGFFPGRPARVVFSVCDQNDGSAYRRRLWSIQPLATRIEERVVKPCAVAGPQAAYTFREQLGVAGELLRDFQAGIETEYECLIVLGPNSLIHELNRRFLLELE